MKKRYLFLGAGGALLIMLGGAGSATADNGPHISGAYTVNGVMPPAGTVVGDNIGAAGDKCASCHRVHTAKGADFLLTAGQEGMCFTCHGPGANGATTNVVDGVGYVAAAADPQKRGTPPVVSGALRGGGFSFALIDSANPTRDLYVSGSELRAQDQKIPVLPYGAPVTSNHSLGAEGTAWGNGAIGSGPGAAVTLECGSCHDPHGNGNYRILKPIPQDSGYTPYQLVPAVLDNPATTTVDESKAAVMSAAGGIKIPDQPVKQYTTLDYWQTGAPGVPATVNGVAAVSPDGFIANISDWCSTCHTRYNAKSGSRSTDSGDAIFTYRHTTTKIDKVGTRNCITCHVAHGSNANMNGKAETGNASAKVPQPDGTTAAEHAVGQAGSRLLRVDNRGICVMCHNF